MNFNRKHSDFKLVLIQTFVTHGVSAVPPQRPLSFRHVPLIYDPIRRMVTHMKQTEIVGNGPDQRRAIRAALSRPLFI